MEKFAFNDCGVCSNPKVVLDLVLEKERARAEVRVAQSPCGRWSMGYGAFFPTHGVGTPVPLVGRGEGYETEDEAVQDGIGRVLEYIDRNGGKVEQKMRELVEKNMPGRKVVQLTLF